MNEVTLGMILEARERLKPVVRKTDLIQSRVLGQMVGTEVYLKAECLQHTGSFKVRGAYNMISQLTPEQKQAGVIASSAGNHAQGVALAAQKFGVKATIVMPAGAPLAKVAATRELGAEVVLHGAVYDDAYNKAMEIQQQTGAVFVHPFNDPLVIGSVRSVRGQFDLLSKIFTLRPSTISFNGGAVSNPLLDVTLRYEVPDITADVRVSGSVRRMKLELTSTPSLPQEEIISRVMFGRGSSELGRFESLRLAAAVARLAGFGSGGLGVLDLGRAVLGVDVLRVNSATDKESGDEESSLEVGKFIGEKIYLGVEQGLEPDSTAVIMELELTPHSKAGIRTEQDNTSAGVQWKMNY